MSTTLLNARIALDKDLGDYFKSTTTGAGSETTLVDTALKAYANDWVTDTTRVMLEEEPAGDAAIYDERKVSSLDSSTGTLTTLAFAAAPGAGIDYSVHRLFSPSDKRTALVQACKLGYPKIHARVRDETKTSGNWLLNGGVEGWASASYPDYWRVADVTAAKTTTAKLYMRGGSSCKLSGAAGYMYQDWSLNDDLKYLRGKAVKFKARGWCDTASALRLAVYDGATTTYSDYHAGDSTWNGRNDEWYVEATISETATDVSFRVYLTSATATGYVDNLRVTSGTYDKVYVGDLSLAQDRPLRISYQYDGSEFSEPWQPVRSYHVDETNRYLLIQGLPSDCKLRIEGVGYLDFLVSGASSTAWTATVALDEPQIKILSAEAVIWLYEQMSLPNFRSGDRKAYQEALSHWKNTVLPERQAKYGMILPPALADWGV